ncbi:MAG: DUF1289 domain-containing protein [Silicimonas sp.]|nr:DUF1289 domain-containing protein [Silicimonas sp.]
MSDPVWRRQEIESPCINVCVLHPQAKLCLGCFRSADEITQWSKMTPETRRAVMDSLPEREKTIPKERRGGRKARIKRGMG